MARNPQPPDSQLPRPPDFEQALAELEHLVERLERGDLPLEDALTSFERGIELTRHCQASLKAAQQRVELLLRRSNGEAEAVPFENGGAGAETSASSPGGAAPATTPEPETDL